MDAYGFWAFFAGLAVGSLLWRINDNIFGMIIYQLYCDFVGKLDKFLMILDADYMYEDYLETHKSKLTYRDYCKAMDAYVPIARRRQRRIVWQFIRYEIVRPWRLVLTLIALAPFIRQLHWVIFGFVAYFTVRYVYHYLDVGRRKEPYALINYLVTDAVNYSQETRKKKSSNLRHKSTANN